MSRWGRAYLIFFGLCCYGLGCYRFSTLGIEAICLFLMALGSAILYVAIKE